VSDLSPPPLPWLAPFQLRKGLESLFLHAYAFNPTWYIYGRIRGRKRVPIRATRRWFALALNILISDDEVRKWWGRAVDEYMRHAIIRGGYRGKYGL
jgi:hypothetical protein